MLKSMTGYGTASLENGQVRIVAEVKTLNSKFLDAQIRLPRVFSEKEIEVRNFIGAQLERGKVSVNIEFQEIGDNSPKMKVNKELVKQYYQDLKETADELGVVGEDLFRMAMQMPQATENVVEEQDDNEAWSMVMDVLKEATDKCSAHRSDEGATLEGKIASNIETIAANLEKVIARDPERVKNIREKVQNHIEEYVGKEGYDKNRFEQELIYYIEKLDINEEKVRLKTHLDYFTDIMKSDKANGKKLGFISQEIGREINTIGSKANDADIQKLVVGMKEELEKIKEQMLNVL